MTRKEEQIQSLIERLASLRVEGDIIRHQEREALQELSVLITGNQLATQAIFVPIRSPRQLKQGDRVRINNSISSTVKGREPTELDRTSTVRDVTAARRILITTDSGIKTWRYLSTLSRIEHQEL